MSDEEVLEVLRARPGDWEIKLKTGNRIWTKTQILAEFNKNGDLRKELRTLLMGLKLHELTRRPPE